MKDAGGFSLAPAKWLSNRNGEQFQKNAPHLRPLSLLMMVAAWPHAALSRFAATIFLAFAGSRIRPFMAVYAPDGSECTAPMAQPMVNAASEPQKRAGLRAPAITMVLSSTDASTWPVCTMLSIPCVTCTCLVDCAAIHARISLDKVLCAPAFRPLCPVALPAKRSGPTQACGRRSQVDHP